MHLFYLSTFEMQFYFAFPLFPGGIYDNVLCRINMFEDKIIASSFIHHKTAFYTHYYFEQSAQLILYCVVGPMLCTIFHQQHNLCCDNCHSHVARALNLMQYNGSHSWNMFKLWFFVMVYGKYVR